MRCAVFFPFSGQAKECSRIYYLNPFLFSAELFVYTKTALKSNFIQFSVRQNFCPENISSL